MPRLRLLSALLTAALAASACDGSGEHNNPDEASQGAAGRDSMQAGTNTPATLPPAGTANPSAPSGPGTSADSASASAVGGPSSPGSGTGPVPAPTPSEQSGDDNPSNNP